jgi:hypothetical protein
VAARLVEGEKILYFKNSSGVERNSQRNQDANLYAKLKVNSLVKGKLNNQCQTTRKNNNEVPRYASKPVSSEKM